MPLIKLEIGKKDIPEQQTTAVLKLISSLVSKETGKPEKYMMCIASKCFSMMGGTPKPCAYVSVTGIGGFNHQINTNITAGVCDILKKECGIMPECIYVTFTDVSAGNWGWNSSLFG